MSRRLLLDDGRNQRELVIRDKMTIGRDPACDISDADPRLSRRHAEFLMTPRGLMVRDLDSRNGVRVNGRMVQEALLTAGDLVELAHLSVRFVEDTPTEPAGQAFPSGIHSGIVPRPVESVQVKEGFEDDRTRVVPAPPLSITPSGPVDGPPTATMMRAALSRDAGEVTIRASQSLPPLRPPRPGFGVRDLAEHGLGRARAGAGRAARRGGVSHHRRADAELVHGCHRPGAELAAGADAGRSAAGGAGGRADGGLAHRAHDRARAWTG